MNKVGCRRGSLLPSTPMTLLNLPNELLIQILAHLNHQDLIACQLSDKALHTTIKHSILLQFRIALSTFKATDNPSCHLSVSERLKALKDSENAWTYLHKDFKRRIAINFEVSGIYDLSGGVFLLGNATRTALHYIKLPSSIDDHVQWKNIELNHSEGMIIDMGFCIHEHDLLAVVTTWVLTVRILFFPTGAHFVLENLVMPGIRTLHTISKSFFSNCLPESLIPQQKKVQSMSSIHIGIDPQLVLRLLAIVSYSSSPITTTFGCLMTVSSYMIGVMQCR